MIDNVFDALTLGLATAFTLENLLFCLLGVVLGTLIGVIPGVGALAAISMLFPVTFYLEPTPALIMLAGIWYGTSYGGSTASILLNIPGTPANAVACLDGYPMARQGRGGVALFMTTAGSFVGGTFGIILMMLFAPLIAKYALSFGPAEYFALMVLGLVSASTISSGSAIKGLAMVVLGIIVGSVGLDLYTGAPRMTMGLIELSDGVGLVSLAMGLFGVGEIITSVRHVVAGTIDRESVRLRAMIPSREDVRASTMPVVRGTLIGSFLGTLPGVGSSIASFMSYAVEKRVSKDPSRFGKGAIEGVVSPEAANNAADQTAFIPTLALGIPGSATMALMMGALIIHGINPGPALMTEQPSLFWGLVMSFWIGNVLLVILNIPMIGLWVRLLLIPYHLLYPAVLMFICLGVYTVNYSEFDVWMVLIFGLIGYGARLLELPVPPMLLGFVLGPLLEEQFRRAMLISRGDFTVFVSRPISSIILALTAMLLLYSVWLAFRSMRHRNEAEPA